MNKASGVAGKIISATAGLTILLTVSLPNLFSIELSTTSVISPIIAAVVISIGDWLIAFFGMDSARCKRIAKNTQDRIDKLRKNIDENTKGGLDNSELNKELFKAIITQSKETEAFNKEL